MASPEKALASADPISIGDRIRDARKQAGVSQVDLARKVGVTQPAVANWESGVHDPRRLMLAKIADALMVSPDWLASGARSPAEADKHPAAAYIRRPIQHTPVISFADAARLLGDPDADPHAVAEDYIPVTSGAEKLSPSLSMMKRSISLFQKRRWLSLIIRTEDRRTAPLASSSSTDRQSFAAGAIIRRAWSQRQRAPLSGQYTSINSPTLSAVCGFQSEFIKSRD